MKTHVITLSKTFPKTHSKIGCPTYFAENLSRGIKIHTIRANYPFWEKRIEEVRNGTACLSIRQWTGKPYASKQIEIARLTAYDGVGIQKIHLGNTKLDKMLGIDNSSFNCLLNDDNKIASILCATTVAENDGLSREDWTEWFKEADYTKPFAIIHFTKFRY